MSKHWKWVDGTVTGKCPGCDKALMIGRDAGIVEYGGKQYHTHCALDLLPAPPAPGYNAYGATWGASP